MSAQPALAKLPSVRRIVITNEGSAKYVAKILYFDGTGASSPLFDTLSEAENWVKQKTEAGDKAV